MDPSTTRFIEITKANPDVLGIILFGSWARGNPHEGSDVDLVVILSEGYKRTVEEHDGQLFELIYTTAD